MLDRKLGKDWTKRGQLLRSQGVSPYWSVEKDAVDEQKTPDANTNYANIIQEDVTETQYELVQRYQAFYESAVVDHVTQMVLSKEHSIDSDARAAARLASELHSNSVVLDFGCNTGLNLNRLASKANTLWGIEWSQDSAAKAKTQLSTLSGKTIDIHQGSITTSLPREFSDQVHGAVFTAVAQHIAPKKLPAVFANIGKALVTGGWAWISFKDIPREQDLQAMGLGHWVGRSFTVEQAQRDLLRQSHLSASARNKFAASLTNRLNQGQAPVYAVMYDQDYVKETEAASLKPGAHNRPFWFYTWTHIEKMALEIGLEVVQLRCYLDAKQPYGAFHWDVKMKKC